jgi:hypothetical protein
MKEYKIDLHEFDGKVREVVSEAIQRHAFELGYPGWRCGGKNVRETRAPYLFIETRRMAMTDTCSMNAFMNDKDTLISVADFLALTPEDVQDEAIVATEPSEWLLVTGGESLTLVPNGTRVVKINGSGVLSVEPFTRTVAERFLPKEGK